MPRPSRRDDALDAAIALVLRDGVAPTMEEIAEAVGMTRQALYLHFGTADALFVAMAERVGEEHGLAARIDQIRATEDADARADTYLDFLSEYWDEVAVVAVALEGGGWVSEAIRAAWEDRERGQRALAHSVIRRFEREGRLDPEWSTETATDVLWALASPVHHQNLRRTCGWSRAQFRRYLRCSLDRLLLEDDFGG